jgi:uncharacterized protein YecE (DUF72 family)
MQFPWSFKRSSDSLQYLDSLYDEFKAFPLCLEVRHDSWLQDNTILDFCRERNIAFCNIDQPVLMHCIAPTAHATALFAYVRLHGRNIENWFNDKADATSRYDYLYKYDELNEWARRMRQLLNQCARVYAVTNNHARGQAVANGIELRSALEPLQVKVPASLAREYPQLLKSPGVKREEDDEQQLELF